MAELPADVPGLYAATFDHAEALFGRGLTNAFLGAIAVSRAGWRETDFRALLPKLSRRTNKARPGMLARLFGYSARQAEGDPWDELCVASLRRLFRGQIRRRGILGQWDFNHAQMRAAVRQRLAAQIVSETKFHAEIAAHLLSLPSDDPLRESETMVHLLGSGDWGRAATFYGSSSLTRREIDGATHVLSDAVLSKRVVDGNEGLDQVLRLLDATTEPAILSTLTHRLMADLGGSISHRAELVGLDRLFGATRTTFDRLAKSDPGNAEWQRELSVSLDAIGDVCRMQGNLPAALENYRAALAIRDRLAKAEPGNADWRYLIGISNEKIGRLKILQGDISAALESYQTKYDIISRLRQADPENTVLQRELGESLAQMGGILHVQGNLPAALENYRASFVIADLMAQIEPRNADRQSDLSQSHQRIGTVHLAQGHLPAALESYRAALVIAEHLAQADPGNTSRQQKLKSAHDHVGKVLAKQSNLPEALEHYRAALAIAERLARADPNNVNWQFDLGTS